MVDTHKKQVVLLGDGFFARGFLHHINYNKFFVTQIYKHSFINPQDIMYSLQRSIKYTKSLHFKDFFTRSPDVKIQLDIKNIDFIKNKETIDTNQIVLNDNVYKYDYLVVGLGAAKSLYDWKEQINNLTDVKNKSIGVVGMGPSGIEIGFIMSKNNKVDMFDMFTKDKVLTFMSQKHKDIILDKLDYKNISTTYGKAYNKSDYNHDMILFCGGTRQLFSEDIKVNKCLQYNNNIYIGGDCVNTSFPKTAQVAYQQGAYVAKKLNGEIPQDQEFIYKSNGSSINIGDNKVLIEGHKILPNGTYPDLIIKLYSLFCI